MTGLFTRIAERALGTGNAVRPVHPPWFGPQPMTQVRPEQDDLVGHEMFESETSENVGQPEMRKRARGSVVPERIEPSIAPPIYHDRRSQQTRPEYEREGKSLFDRMSGTVSQSTPLPSLSKEEGQNASAEGREDRLPQNPPEHRPIRPLAEQPEQSPTPPANLGIQANHSHKTEGEPTRRATRNGDEQRPSPIRDHNFEWPLTESMNHDRPFVRAIEPVVSKQRAQERWGDLDTARLRKEPQPAPTINVTIGRVEVRAIQEAPPAPKRKIVNAKPALSLEAYLEQRSQGKR